ncbi:MAG: hypothetical protein WC897_02105 [Candidatus Gracilibacteria bacterium]
MRFNFLNKGFLERKASAILLSFFMMTVLILVAISVSILVVRDLATVRTIVAGEQASYSAEGMTELGLAIVNENLPGYEVSLDGLSYLDSALASMNIIAQNHSSESVLPCVGQGDTWRALARNESIQIPLFIQTDPEDTIAKIDGFRVEFYVGDADGKSASNPPGSDVLRWKVLGLAESKTEAMSEYISLISEKHDETNPSVFGTDVTGEPEEYSSGKSFISGAGMFSVKFRVYPILNFLMSHSYSYLVLTNVVTEDLSTDGSQSFIHFRFVSTDTDANAVCEYVKIASTGVVSLGEVRKELITLVKEGENLPVFDFVLYHTTGEKL